MTKRTRAPEIPLIKRPITEIMRITNEAGRSAAANAELIQSASREMRFEWIGKAFPTGLGMSDDEFNDIIVQACNAFDKGIDEYCDGLNEAVQQRPARLPGVGYWFSEDDTFAFGLMVDTSKFSAERLDANALFDRFRVRLVSEYDRIALQVGAARADGADISFSDKEDEPLSIRMTVDETIFLQIVPAAIDRTTLDERLPPMLREFVGLLADDATAGSDPFPIAI
jgi:hypothetical protein